ncbi:hypothetical protein XNC1_0502 [Xenorhabdus nematophila ATCC 19061]|uniref:Uncharacterized protein n=1 Tax=Xenorhabdus nematophila (strain ATCC 19061 / DSM 3370 / CCUG 14189 / LMG 1036 / NCIMB 9965 / AN6) TaxID=406817 RepID=D3VIM6_XENNA|nr:hypothetical protein XNC1_0502 [Xenorhabdus nematophila ATCC 19061]
MDPIYCQWSQPTSSYTFFSKQPCKLGSMSKWLLNDYYGKDTCC